MQIVDKTKRHKTNTRYLVVAGSVREYDKWRREHKINPRDAIYVHRAEVLLARRAVDYKLVFIGGWYKRTITNQTEVRDQLRAMGYSVKQIEEAICKGEGGPA